MNVQSSAKECLFSESILRLGELSYYRSCRCCRSVSAILRCVGWQEVLDVLKDVTYCDLAKRVGKYLPVEKALRP